jgi:hypothetical protein
MKSFMAVTFQYINDDLEMVYGILDFVKLKGKHEGKLLAASLVDIFEEFALSKSQVFTVTVDNASNNNTMIEELIKVGYIQSPEHHIRCFAHILNLAAQDLLAYIADLVKQLRINNKFIRKSPQRLEQFVLICQINNETFNKPQVDSKTRWNSTYDMLLVNLKLKRSMDEFISKQGQCTTFVEEICDGYDQAKVVKKTAKPLREEDWKLVETIASILKPINEATLAMCAEKVPTISLMMPFFDSVLEALRDVKDLFRILGAGSDEADTIADGAEAGYDKLLKYFEVSSDLGILAAVLDPRLKMDYYKESENSEHLEIVKGLVTQIAARFKLDSESTNEPAVVTKSRALHLPAYLRDKKRSLANKTTLAELNQYLQEPAVDVDDNEEFRPLKWWNANKYEILKIGIGSLDWSK